MGFAVGQVFHTACQVSWTAKAFTEEDVELAVEDVIKARTKDGAFLHKDPRTAEILKLKFEKIRIVRGMAGHGWFLVKLPRCMRWTC